ncbi:MAG TPA: hypothetical protein VJM31_08315 [Vicinamibacterales bacterium]|nr:hypothetical protein [Vicinamibacterales bacterium]
MLHVTTATNRELTIPANRQTAIVERVRGEFREMPGLTLTLAQAGRLWSVDATTCREVLTELVESGFLSRRADGAFCRTSDLAVRRFVEA